MYLYHAIENATNQNTEKPLSVYSMVLHPTFPTRYDFLFPPKFSMNTLIESREFVENHTFVWRKEISNEKNFALRRVSNQFMVMQLGKK